MYDVILQPFIIIIIIIQQFITQSMVADCSSYFVTIYNRSRLHEEKENKKKNKKRTKKTNRSKLKRKK